MSSGKNYGRLLKVVIISLTSVAIFTVMALIKPSPNEQNFQPQAVLVLESAKTEVRGSHFSAEDVIINETLPTVPHLTHSQLPSSKPKSTSAQIQQSSIEKSNINRLTDYSKLRSVNASIVTQFVFTKIEKTGSSTFFAALSRFVKKHHLNILIQKRRVHIDWKKAKGVGWDIGPEPVFQADVLINHALFKKPVIDKYVRPGYKYIVMIREPVSWFKSATKYYKNKVNQLSAEKVVMNDHYMYLVRTDFNGGPTGLHSWFHLVQLQWLGFDYKQKDNMSAIEEHISWLNKQIDVIMIHEQYDPSLVVLRRRFGWSYTDIFYRRYIITNSHDVPLSNQAREKLLSPKVNLGEKLLYDSLNKTWWQQPELKEDSFWDEVKFFSELNLQTSQKFCPTVLSNKKPILLPNNKWCQQEILTVDLCTQLLEKQYDKMVTQLGTYALGSSYHY